MWKAIGKLILLLLIFFIFVFGNIFLSIKIEEKIRPLPYGGGQACMNARLTINDTFENTCYKPNKEVKVMILRGAEDFNLAEMDIVVIGGGIIALFPINESNKGYSKIRMLDGSYNGPITLPGVNEEKTYVVNAGDRLKDIKEIRVVPKVKAGQMIKNCGVTHQVELEKCNQTQSIF